MRVFSSLTHLILFQPTWHIPTQSGNEFEEHQRNALSVSVFVLWKISILCQFVIFKPLSYCFKETIGFDVKVWFASRPLSRLIRWYNKAGDITKKFWEKAIQFYGTFHEMKITNCVLNINICLYMTVHFKFS